MNNHEPVIDPFDDDFEDDPKLRESPTERGLRKARRVLVGISLVGFLLAVVCSVISGNTRDESLEAICFFLIRLFLSVSLSGLFGLLIAFRWKSFHFSVARSVHPLRFRNSFFRLLAVNFVVFIGITIINGLACWTIPRELLLLCFILLPLFVSLALTAAIRARYLMRAYFVGLSVSLITMLIIAAWRIELIQMIYATSRFNSFSMNYPFNRYGLADSQLAGPVFWGIEIFTGLSMFTATANAGLASLVLFSNAGPDDDRD